MSLWVLPGGKKACLWVGGGAVPYEQVSTEDWEGKTSRRTMTSLQSRRDALLWPRRESLEKVCWKLDAMVAWLTELRVSIIRKIC